MRCYVTLQVQVFSTLADFSSGQPQDPGSVRQVAFSAGPVVLKTKSSTGIFNAGNVITITGPPGLISTCLVNAASGAVSYAFMTPNDQAQMKSHAWCPVGTVVLSV